mmetsp:Transcript_1824/g.2336  ORF Transcript_1824/g.2336 Transcript_1824/m.2336 type:complete len:316 (-) Transcript_1824:309-1256(-)|eukprot:CAMPEP_0117735130 /NCGR_PEP_ID=MMETSP0947-20121206/1106_1 /TAXON_ID=44440 /ORGANISM="Chattonella subsalsa, Strain CCMP2191" /LENGTH=315 /DNA_ID=CAMNT_0005550081 /DNA_START=19 /DNA_END=966 /DNA_ORIENTATION=-
MSGNNAIEHSSLSVRLKRPNKTYFPGDLVEGVVVVSAKDYWAHQGVTMAVEGRATLELGGDSGMGLLDSLYQTARPLDLLMLNFDVTGAGRVAAGVTEIPFEFVLEEAGGCPLHETYHGVYTTVSYIITVECRRTLMRSTLTFQEELVVECPSEMRAAPVPMEFSISPDKLENVDRSQIQTIPRFSITGKLDSIHCAINKPFTGQVTIEESEARIQSIEIQLVRVESVIAEDKEHREATEIQNIQIADGDIPHGTTLPIYFVFPRLFSCCSITSSLYKVEFEVNLLVIFNNNFMVTENFPIVLHREKGVSPFCWQ